MSRHGTGIAFALFLSLLAAGPWGSAGAHTYYLGVGNNEFAPDVDTAVNALRRIGSVHERRVYDQDRGILAEIVAIGRRLVAGDVFIFHYSGHGGLRGDTGFNDEGGGDEGIIGTLNAAREFTANAVTDDDVAQAINALRDDVAVLSIFDSCHAGEMIDGTADIDRGAVIGTAATGCIAPTSSIFLPLWNAALAWGPRGIAADTNHDGRLVFGELYDALDGISGSSRPFAANFDGTTRDDYRIGVPVPSTALLLAAGLVALRRARR